MKKLKISIAALLLINNPVKSEDKFNSLDVMKESLSFSCIDWKPTGVCFWLKCSAFPPICSVKSSIKVRHYNPDAIVQVYQNPGSTPWKEMSFVSELLKLGQSGSTPVGRQHNSVNKQSAKVINRHVDVIGSPGALTVSAMLSGGSVISDMKEVLSDTSNIVDGMRELSSQSSALKVVNSINNSESIKKMKELSGSLSRNLSFLEDMTGNVDALEFVSSYGGALSALADVLKAANSVTSVIDSIQEISALTESLGALNELQASIDIFSSILDSVNFYCGGAVSPFIPYFVSTLDYFSWKYPYAEFLKAGTWVPGLREVGNRDDGGNERYLFTGRFGSVYPRIGALIQNDAYKASAVFAQRAADIVTDPSAFHLRKYLGDKNSKDGYEPPGQIKEWSSKDGKWQMLYPKMESQCHIFGEPSTRKDSSLGPILDGYSHRRSKSGDYAWQLWRPYECCKKMGQKFLFAIEL